MGAEGVNMGTRFIAMGTAKCERALVNASELVN